MEIKETDSNQTNETPSNQKNKSATNYYDIVCNLFNEALDVCKKLYKKYILKKSKNEHLLDALLVQLNNLENARIQYMKEYALLEKQRRKQKFIEKEKKLKEDKQIQIEYINIQNNLKCEESRLTKLIDNHKIEYKQLDAKLNTIEQKLVNQQQIIEEYNRLEKENDRLETEQLDREKLKQKTTEENYIKCRRILLEKIQELNNIIN